MIEKISSVIVLDKVTITYKAEHIVFKNKFNLLECKVDSDLETFELRNYLFSLNRYYMTQLQSIIIDEVIRAIKIDNTKSLYFMKDNTGNIKIGVSVDPYSRILNFDNKKEIQIVKILPQCGSYESRLHRLFSELNIKYTQKFDGYTEWFIPKKPLLKYINEVSVDNIEKTTTKYESRR